MPDEVSPSAASIPIASTSAAGMPRPLVHVEHVMGTVVSFDVRLAEEPARVPMRAAVADAVGWLHRVDHVFSTYQPGSQVSRLGRGELRLVDCDGDVAEVLEEFDPCRIMRVGPQMTVPSGQLRRLLPAAAVQRAST